MCFNSKSVQHKSKGQRHCSQGHDIGAPLLQVIVLENPENGAIEHAELKFGNSFVIGDEAERAKPGSISSYTEFTSEAALNAYAADLRNKGSICAGRA